jgi:transposase
VPYDWQLRGETLEIPSVHSQRLNVLGFLNLNGSFESYVFEGSIDSEVLIKCFDDYCQRMKQPLLIVLGNAPVHKIAALESRIERWEEQWLYLLFLLPYCPDLNH